jgi:hypothetical protein
VERKQLDQLREEVSRILFEVWDPIGVYDADDPESWPDVRDEYTSYEIEILSSVIGGASEEQIGSRLLQLCRNNMGLSSHHAEERSDLAAKALAELRAKT